MSLPASWACWLTKVRCRRAFLSVWEHAPDADRGVSVPAAVITQCAAGAALPCSPAADWGGVAHGPGCLLALHVPDFSMPYNVMCLVLIVVFIYLAGTWSAVYQHSRPCRPKGE